MDVIFIVYCCMYTVLKFDTCTCKFTVLRTYMYEEKIISILKALCHAIRADCLLIEAARAHPVNEQWAW